jgi:hypothetical protein
MTTDLLRQSYLAALAALEVSGPKPLLKRAEFEADDRAAEVNLKELGSYLAGATLNDPLRIQLHLALAAWDSAPGSPIWAGAEPPRTPSRRDHILKALALDGPTTDLFNALFPVSTDHPTVISDEFEPWFNEERRAGHDFYWSAYKTYLAQVRHWPPSSLSGLDDATDLVVERLSDPTREEAYQAKGLIVGYVQSGKTANFTGVVAKAIDAGYRLIIVLTGTVDLLREQTQRRLDMELVGTENILRGVNPDDGDLLANIDYQDDPDWKSGKFVSHGFLPSDRHLPDIIRLTTHRFDYKRLQQGITALEFEKVDKTKPLFAAENLYRAGARLVIVKKNKSVLEKLVKDLKSISSRLGEIPALIIDDESDQASVNTSNPKKWAQGRTERTAINGLISSLLHLLPRSQYLGYTATPFANVFIDPSDTEDIFPKDFLISLQRPPGYMGVSDFHDLDIEVEPEDRDASNSQEKAFVRDLRNQGPDRLSELREAIDAFVLSGAIKLYRSGDFPPDQFRHHTMLVHESVKQAEHAVLASEIRATWAQAGYSTATGMARLRSLYDGDFYPVCQARAGDLRFPSSFDELNTYVAQAISRITGTGGDPVIVVNGDKDLAQEAIDFDKRPVWRILVGGTKLSRGFTVEGLTVSYYRRRTQQADTLMQMGRWFGFRSGYMDLVRLYIGRAEGTQRVDLYAAFEAIVRDEEAFREQLRKYSQVIDGRPQVTPAQIPPLVSQHLPTLRPTSPNKMFNARLVIRRSPGTPVEPTGYPKSPADLGHNYDAMSPLLAAASTKVTFLVPQSPSAKASSFEAFMGLVDHTTLLTALAALRWIVDDYFEPDLNFLRELGEDAVEDWAVILPQGGSRGMSRALPGIGQRSVFLRARRRDPLFGVISESRHRHAPIRIASARSAIAYGDKEVEDLRTERRGAILVYPVVEEQLNPAQSADTVDPQDVVTAFVLVAPGESVPVGTQLVQFVARDKKAEKAAIVDVPGSA